MFINRLSSCFLSLCLIGVTDIARASQSSQGWVYQTGPITGLLQGLFQGNVSCAELLKHGEIGLGTFDALDGEMIVLDGKVYAAREDGSVHQPKQCLSPFATVAQLSKLARTEALTAVNRQDFEKKIDALVPAQNSIVIIKFKAKLNQLTVRVAPKQKKPFPKLSVAVKNQPVFHFKNIKGTLVGFRFPAYLQAINVPGYHLHFVSDDQKYAGHVFDFQVSSGTISLEEAQGLQLAIPADADFKMTDLTPHSEAEINQVEKQKK